MSATIALPEPLTVTPPPTGSASSAGTSPAARSPDTRRADVVVIPDTDWDTYRRLGEAFLLRPKVRLIYDRGRLQIMAPSLEHDDDSRTFVSILTMACLELAVPLKLGGSVTMQREDLARGIEGDEVFWTRSASRIAGVRDLDLSIHPPPDLAIEVEVSRSILDKPAIYAAIGVPELWRLDGDRLGFFALGPDQRYLPISNSLSFPPLTPEDVVRVLLRARASEDVIPVMREFREWLGQRLTPPGTPTPGPSAG